jgi:hypothetical protein
VGADSDIEDTTWLKEWADVSIATVRARRSAATVTGASLGTGTKFPVAELDFSSDVTATVDISGLAPSVLARMGRYAVVLLRRSGGTGLGLQEVSLTGTAVPIALGAALANTKAVAERKLDEALVDVRHDSLRRLFSVCSPPLAMEAVCYGA